MRESSETLQSLVIRALRLRLRTQMRRRLTVAGKSSVEAAPSE